MESVQLDVPTLSLLVGTVIPVLVGVVTKIAAPSGLKAIVNLVLSAVSAALTLAIEGDGLVEDPEVFLMTTLMTFVVSVATHYGLLKPALVTGSQGAVQRSTASVGIG